MTTEHNNLVTRIEDLEAQLEAARVGLRDQFAMVAFPIVFDMSKNLDNTKGIDPNLLLKAMWTDSYRIADAAMEVRGNTNPIPRSVADDMAKALEVLAKVYELSPMKGYRPEDVSIWTRQSSQGTDHRVTLKNCLEATEALANYKKAIGE